MKKRYVMTGDRQQGSTLLEVLIALLVLSVGLLGLAALQTTALRFSQAAAMQRHAVQLVRNIGERMRANPGGVRRGEYTLTRGQVPAAATGIARADLRAWLAEVARLPAGRGEITPCTRTSAITCPDEDAHIVTVYWNAARDPATRGYRCPPRPGSAASCYRRLIR